MHEVFSMFFSAEAEEEDMPVNLGNIKEEKIYIYIIFLKIHRTIELTLQ